MNTVPIVFTFDANYRLPASVALQSLFENAKDSTYYHVYLVCEGLSRGDKDAIESICPERNGRVEWIDVDNELFSSAPSSENWPKIVYARILLPLLLPFDKVIYSDVDVVFCSDLAEIFQIEVDGCEWAGVAAELVAFQEGVARCHNVHCEYQNELIYMSGFMVMNLRLMREKDTVGRCLNNISKFGSRLKMYDLEILNMSSDNIARIDFSYCVLENVFFAKNVSEAKEYPWLRGLYRVSELEAARSAPRIIHFAGSDTKVWERYCVPQVYRKYLAVSPFRSCYVFSNVFKVLLLLVVRLVTKVVPKKQRDFIRRRAKWLCSQSFSCWFRKGFLAN